MQGTLRLYKNIITAAVEEKQFLSLSLLHVVNENRELGLEFEVM